MRRLLLVSLIALTGCYAELGVGAVGGAVEPTALGGGPVFTAAAGVYLEEEPRALAGGVAGGGDLASLGFDSFEELVIGTAVSGYLDVTLHPIEPDALYVRWTSAASIGGGGLRLRTGVRESAIFTLFSGVGMTWFLDDTLSFVTIALGPFALFTTNPGALVGGQARLRAGFWL